MFRAKLSINNTLKNHLKGRTQHYLNNFQEPKDNVSHDSPIKDEKVLTGDSSIMRHKFRGIAQRIRFIRLQSDKKSPRANNE
jgi:hypothetical protein